MAKLTIAEMNAQAQLRVAALAEIVAMHEANMQALDDDPGSISRKLAAYYRTKAKREAD